MRVLIVSRTPWDQSNSFGNTFSNLFEGMPGVEIFNICCQGGPAHNHVVKQSFQMTDKAVLESVLKPHRDVGVRVAAEAHKKGPVLEQTDFPGINYRKIVAKRSYAALIGRDLIWKMGRWKTSEGLRKFVEDVHPDLLYLPIYNSWYMCDLQQYLVDVLQIPTAGHISDDVYSFPQGYMASPMHLLYVSRTRAKLRKLISCCSYLEVFAENMQKEYAKIFEKPCYLIGKGIDVNNLAYSNPCLLIDKNEVNFVYTGNVGSERWIVLCEIGRSLEILSSRYGKKYNLQIYTATNMTSEMEKKFAESSAIHLMGAVSSDQVKNVQNNADVLVHVESYSPKAICETRMSFSTKIIDYICSGKPLLAVGPIEVNSISFLKAHELAIVPTEFRDIQNTLEQLLRDQINTAHMTEHGRDYLIQNRNIHDIQSKMYDRMKSLLS